MSQETLRYLNNLELFGWRLGFERIQTLSRFLGYPERKYPAVHIAGTNGKGSTAAMLAAIAKASGLRTGLYTSPHLVHVTERIQVDNQPIPAREFEHLLQSCRQIVDSQRATYFEVMTAIAFTVFAEHNVDLAIVETGLGGRLDATNIVRPEVAVITSVGLEHQQHLGATLAEIAREKAGIIKTGRPCVSAVRQPLARRVLAQRCRNQRARFIDSHAVARISSVRHSPAVSCFAMQSDEFAIDWPEIRINLMGRHQIDNAVLAILAAHLLRRRGFPFDPSSIFEGLRNVCWPARLQLIEESESHPRMVLDVAHNVESVERHVNTIKELFSFRRLRVVLALMNDKSLDSIFGAWQGLQPEFYFTRTSSSRSFPPIELLRAARRMGFSGSAFESPLQAFGHAGENCEAGDLLCVVGSHFLIGDLMAAGLLPYPDSWRSDGP